MVHNISFKIGSRFLPDSYSMCTSYTLISLACSAQTQFGHTFTAVQHYIGQQIATLQVHWLTIYMAWYNCMVQLSNYVYYMMNPFNVTMAAIHSYYFTPNIVASYNCISVCIISFVYQVKLSQIPSIVNYLARYIATQLANCDQILEN